MQAPADAKSRFIENLPHIDRVLAGLSRRLGLRGDDADEFASWAKERLIDDDYAVIGKFRGESSIGTYLTVVLSMLGREYVVKERGRWRASAAARRSGALAIRLETLVYRDGFSLSRAGEELRTRGETTLADRELGVILASIPRRTGLRRQAPGDDVLDTTASDDRADELVEAETADTERKQVAAVLTDALAQLPDEERVMVRLRFWQQLSVAQIARALNVPQKPLYRRFERALEQLRRHLNTAGVSQELIRGFTNVESSESFELMPIYTIREAEGLQRVKGADRS